MIQMAKKSEEQNKCDDRYCPIHGSLKLRGREFQGTIVSSKMQKTVSVEWETRKKVPKYERYEKRKSNVKAHNPTCISAKEGDIVVIKECRPLSKTKKFAVVKVLEK